VVSLLERVLGLAYRGRPGRASGQRLPHARISATRRNGGSRRAQRLTLARIARALDCSVFHLCRSFRRATGLTLHRYQDAVRLRLALERLGDGERDLSRLALDLGYSSHSHFSAAFRQSFRVAPSAARKLLIVRA
jgi:AraC-like DNA-binding protein